MPCSCLLSKEADGEPVQMRKAAVSRCPSLGKKQRTRKQLVTQLKVTHRALWLWLHVVQLPLHPVPRDLSHEAQGITEA